MTTLKIAAIGFDNGEATFIRAVVSMATELDEGGWGYVDRREEADVLLVRIRSDRGERKIPDFSSGTDEQKPRVIPCTDDPAVAEAHPLTLRRPVTYPDLVKLLLELQQDLRPEDPSSSTPSATLEPELATALIVEFPSGSTRGQIASREMDESAERSDAETATGTCVDEQAEALDASPSDMDEVHPTTLTESIARSFGLEDAGTIYVPRDEVDDPEKLVSSTYADEAQTTQALAEQASGDNSLRPDAKAFGEDLLREVAETEGSPPRSEQDGSEHLPADPDEEEPAPNLGMGESPPLAAPVTSAEHDKQANRRDEEMLKRDRPARKFYEVSRFLGIVKNVVARGEVTAVIHEHFPPVRIYPEQQIYMTPSDGLPDTEMFRTLASEFTTCPVTKEHLRVPSPEWQTAPLWCLLYLAALYGSEGRLKESAHHSDKLHFIAEPDFDLVPNVDEHRRIASYMLTETADIAAIAAATDVSVETVIDFSNACEEVALVERGSWVARDASASTEGPKEVANRERRRGFLKRVQSLMNRVG